MTWTKWRWLLLISVNVAMWCVLSLYRPSAAAPQAGQLPFANSVEQRNQMIRELKEINAQLKQQNALLRAGNLRVVVVEKQSP